MKMNKQHSFTLTFLATDQLMQSVQELWSVIPHLLDSSETNRALVESHYHPTALLYHLDFIAGGRHEILHLMQSWIRNCTFLNLEMHSLSVIKSNELFTTVLIECTEYITPRYTPVAVPLLGLDISTKLVLMREGEGGAWMIAEQQDRFCEAPAIKILVSIVYAWLVGWWLPTFLGVDQVQITQSLYDLVKRSWSVLLLLLA
jgi:hypothetical protein